MKDRHAGPHRTTDAILSHRYELELPRGDHRRVDPQNTLETLNNLGIQLANTWAKNNSTLRIRNGKECERTVKPLIFLSGSNFRKGKHVAFAERLIRNAGQVVITSRPLYMARTLVECSWNFADFAENEKS